MTADERRQQRAQILIDLEDAEAELRSLQVKAMRVSEGFDRISNKIKHNANLAPVPEDFIPDFEMKNRLDPRSQADFISYSDALRLIEDLKVARQKVFNLKDQKERA